MAANGRVITGFSKPYVATYGISGGALDYTDAQVLARGVDVSIEPETPDDNNYYGDNEIIESAAGIFTGGTLNLTVDGLLDAAEALILGLPAAVTYTVDGNSVTARQYGDGMSIPYCGVGFVVRYMSDGVTTYVPVILHKVKFNTPNTSAATQEDAIDWQSQSLTATIYRDDTTDHNWKTVFTGQATESAAEACISAFLV